MDFVKRYANLNAAQKEAVDAIDGPVMVIAGPGTGKTELLGVRVANILQKTDTLPENILCLTFTDSGANAMRQRLIDIIGPDAYKVAIHTFHSFGTEVINQNGQYFYNGASFKPSDGVSSYEVIRKIFEKLDFNNPLISQMNGEYTHISDALKVISELKKSGLSSTELLQILDENDETIFEVEKILTPIFTNSISKSTAIEAAKYIPKIAKFSAGSKIPGVISLAEIIANTLTTATDTAISTGKTPAITKWRNDWFEKDKANNFVMKSRNRQIKLRAIIHIYDEYLLQMEKAEIFDYDDMILQIVRGMEQNDDLRFNLQEKFQYIMVDEFQDTNMAQMRILHNLTNNEVQGDTPNIMVVGDDDQAIYSFQGANVSNILDFPKRYPRAKLITLTENYRSNTDVLENSRNVITQGSDRLENTISGISKLLHSNSPSTGEVNLYQSETLVDERSWIAKNIKSQIDSGTRPADIAILTRHHNDILELLPYLYQQNIAVNYERSDDALQQEIIIFIEKIAKLLIDIADGRHDNANSRIPEIFAHKAWAFNPIDIWKLSVAAYDNHTRWLDIMSESAVFMPMYKWLISTSSLVNDAPLEKMLDIIIGSPNLAENDDAAEFISPIYQHFFSENRMQNQPNEYLIYLESLRAIRNKLREYHTNETPTLKTFVDFIALSRKIKNVISINRRTNVAGDSINVMTAHKAKGLEFDTVYIMNAVDTVWGDHSKGRNRLINYPENLRLAPAGETNDERLRLFYVAMTRAKNHLNICFSKLNNNNKLSLIASFLSNSKLAINTIPSQNNLIESAELDWYQPLIEPVNQKMRDLLLPRLEDYKLSITHMQNFLNVKHGGPQTFLLKNLLQFPQEKGASAAFGTAVHDALQFAHNRFASGEGRLPIDKIIAKFADILKTQHLSENDYQLMLDRGQAALKTYFEKEYDSFSTSQQSELNFNNQHCIVDDAHLSGKLDLVEIDKITKSLTVTDYKTGKQFYDWSGKDDAAKIKLHHYKQQLMFYKLLVESSRDYNKYAVKQGIMQFVEPTSDDQILSIDTDFTGDDMERFKSLINAVWQHITQLDLPDISEYDQSYKGIITFETDLIENKK